MSASFPVANVLEIFVGAAFNSAITLDGERRDVSLFGFEAGGGGGGGRGGVGDSGPDLDVWPGLLQGCASRKLNPGLPDRGALRVG